MCADTAAPISDDASAVGFRRATREDVAAIVALIDGSSRAGRGADSAPPHPAYLAAFDEIEANPDEHMVVGEAAGRIVACGQLTVHRSSTRRCGQIEGVRAASGAGRAGVYAETIMHLTALAQVEGCDEVWSFVVNAREQARIFYGRLAFVATGAGRTLDS